MDHDGLVDTVECCLGVFYANYGMVGSRDLDWLKHAMKVLVGLFRSYGLGSNLSKSRTMSCQPGALQARILEESMVLKCMGVGDSYQVRLQRRIPCLECVVDLSTGSMTAHRRYIHRMEPEIGWSRQPFIQTEHQPKVYDVSFPRSTK